MYVSAACVLAGAVGGVMGAEAIFRTRPGPSRARQTSCWNARPAAGVGHVSLPRSLTIGHSVVEITSCSCSYSDRADDMKTVTWCSYPGAVRQGV